MRESSRSVAETVDRLTQAIERAGAAVIAVVDHQAAAERAGLQLPPATVVMFGNPRIGTPLMHADPRTALDLPLKMLVWEQDGITRLGYLAVPVLAERYDLPPDGSELRRMEQALDSLASAALARGELGAQQSQR